MAEARREDLPFVEPSMLDDLSPAKMLTRDRQSTDMIRFAKSPQWRALGATLLIFGAPMVVATHNAANVTLVRALMAGSLISGAGSIFALVIFQIWQNTERHKLRAIPSNSSSLACDVRALKPQLKSDIFRYPLACPHDRHLDPGLRGADRRSRQIHFIEPRIFLSLTAGRLGSARPDGPIVPG